MAVTVTRTLADYADLLDRPAPESVQHVPMDRVARAAQFSSFKALNGFEDSIEETGRLTQEEPEEPCTQEPWYINDRLTILQEHLPQKPEVRITRYLPDKRKPGGSLQQLTGRVKRIDSHQGLLILYAANGISDGEQVPILHIRSLESELFSELVW